MKRIVVLVIAVVVLVGFIVGLRFVNRAIDGAVAKENRRRYEVCVVNQSGECIQHILARRAYRATTMFADRGYWCVRGVDGRSYRISAPVVIKQIADAD